MSRHPLIVIFATRNGAETLGQTLEGYVKLDQPDRPWRLIAVNNGSNDDTAAIFESYRDKLPLMVIDQDRPGKNVALNTALDAARSSADRGPQLYVFTDDDAVPDRDFLTVWASVGDEKPAHDLFGGQVAAEFTAMPPAWLDDCKAQFAELYAQNKRPEGDIPARRIFGPNMAVRATVFEHGLRFDETIGPNGRPDYAMGSETEFCMRAERELGAKAWFVDRVRVRHLVRPWQMTPEFFASRAMRHGRGVAQQQVGGGRISPRRVLRAGWGYAANRARAALASEHDRYHAMWQANWWKGYLDASLTYGHRGDAK